MINVFFLRFFADDDAVDDDATDGAAADDAVVVCLTVTTADEIVAVAEVVAVDFCWIWKSIEQNWKWETSD